jgi:thiol-disulfide isomerase/thioredoxin
MKKEAILIAIFFIMYTVQGQTIPKWKITDVVDYYSKNNDSIYIINFWSTYCQPCIEEIPYLQRISKQYEAQKVKLVLVSLDVASFYPKKLKSFVSKRKFTAQVVWLNETNADIFCPAIDAKWSGAIPATIIVNNKKGYKQFYEEQFTPSQFEEAVKAAL